MSVFSILERLAPHVEKEVNLILKSKQEAQTLKSKLERIHEGLQDAERHGVTDTSVKHWLGELEDVMYEMDDALDQWEMMNIELQIAQQSECDDDYVFDPWEKVRSLFSSLCSSFKHVLCRRKLTQEMISLSGKLDKILDKRNMYNFVSSDRSLHNSSQLEKQPRSTSALGKYKLHGRKYDMDSLVELMLSKGECNDAFVVSIVGIGGLGKTTLARLVYKDRRVEEHFGRLKAWVSVTNPFDASHVAQEIVRNFDKSLSGDTSLEILGQRMKAIASNKKFLLVLDNVWTVDRVKWESVMNFLVDEAGFRILVTTRDAIAARTIGTTHWPRLNLLSDSDCATILNTIALEEMSGEKHQEFRGIGVEIAKKCNGLPLAAETVGRALASRTTIKGWRDILESPLWKHEDELEDIFRPLRLSYMDLSPLLKRCFLSCVLFSKGFEFDSEGLIRIWMAQGYIDSSSERDEVLTKGDKILKTLTERSFFQVSGSNNEGNPTYKMHDIMYDFATYLSRSESYIIVDGRENQRPYHITREGRIRYFSARCVSKKDLPRNLFTLLKSARVLCLSDCDLEEFNSEDIGKLIHLRYLDLSGNHMKELPNTVTDLYNLQTLDLRRCCYLSRLPRGLKKLIKLRHLLISDTERLLEFHEELSKLTGLWTLDKCTAARDSLLHFNKVRDSNLPIICHDQMDEAAEYPNADRRCAQVALFSRGPSPFSLIAGCLPLISTCKNDIEEAAEARRSEMRQFDGSSITRDEFEKLLEFSAYNGKVEAVEDTEFICGTTNEAQHQHTTRLLLSEIRAEFCESDTNEAPVPGSSDQLRILRDPSISTCRLHIEAEAEARRSHEDQNRGSFITIDELAFGEEEIETNCIKQEAVIQNVNAPQRLYPGHSRPSTITSKYLNNLRTLDINGSEYSYLPQLGKLPMLVTLRIQKMDFKAVTLEFFGFSNGATDVAGFPKLETLTFSECEFWEEWEDVEEATTTTNSAATIMPCLNYLAITLCPNLEALPHRLLRAAASLQQLFVAGCPRLASAYDQEMGADWDQISHIPNTIFLASY